MAAAAARLPFHPPLTPKLKPLHPQSLPAPLQRKPLLTLSPIRSSLVEQDQSLSFTEPEATLIEALLGIQGRGRGASAQQVKDVEDAVQVLEDLKGVPDPTSSGLIEGRWQLIFTTRPGTASPIQRTFVGVDIFKVFQEVYLRTDDQRVSNIVKFSDAIGELKVEAAATVQDGKRILFRFDRAAFSFKFLPFKVPYPVPFRLLGDEAKGWLDTTYLSPTGNIRISRGNKGTTFVLQKSFEPRQRLLEAVSSGSGVNQAIEDLVLSRKKEESEYDDDATLEGEWQLVWASKTEDQNREAAVAEGLKGLQTVKKGRLENLINFLPGFTYLASGNLIKTTSTNTFKVSMDDGHALVGGLKFPIRVKSEYALQILYIDKKIRVSRSDKGITYIHLRLEGTGNRSTT